MASRSISAPTSLPLVGCIMFEILTGQPPFIGEGAGDVLAAHIATTPPRVASITPDIPTEIEALVQGLLVKDPKSRTQSARALVVAIDAILPDRSFGTGRDWTAPGLSTPGTAATVASEPRAITPVVAARPVLGSVSTLSSVAGSATKPPPTRNRRTGVLLGGVLAVIVVIGGGAVLFATRGGDEHPSAIASGSAQAAVPASGPQRAADRHAGRVTGDGRLRFRCSAACSRLPAADDRGRTRQHPRWRGGRSGRRRDR